MFPKNRVPMPGFPDRLKDEYSKKLKNVGYTVLSQGIFQEK